MAWSGISMTRIYLIHERAKEKQAKQVRKTMEWLWCPRFRVRTQSELLSPTGYYETDSATLGSLAWVCRVRKGTLSQLLNWKHSIICNSTQDFKNWIDDCKLYSQCFTQSSVYMFVIIVLWCMNTKHTSGSKNKLTHQSFRTVVKIVCCSSSQTPQMTTTI